MELFSAIDAVENPIKFSTSFVVKVAALVLVVDVAVVLVVVRNESDSVTIISEPTRTIDDVVAVVVEVVVDVIKLKLWVRPLVVLHAPQTSPLRYSSDRS